MFILTDKLSGGIYAVQNQDMKKTVHIFEEKDDAVRYVEMLNADDYPDELELMEIDTNVVAINCDKYGYNYSIVRKDDLVIPPS
ncbi:hypothetical protein [Synechococcus phage S-E7]|jgi:hypothetical protein|uniref:Uncharacterized protein n=2 Tax=Leucotheavirus TaxID=2733109 RepID=M4SIW4_9CAUD|nr:hypothetical protein CPRG_00163 [Synechococcus phage Syn30]YP_009816062.1 hypothetical protein HOU57_gp096 [Synechococcus phage S-P4]AGH56247.1 hypothetical protein CPRG_00163 [Synechococcus phage Syn30]AYR01877.1 hypothetical protein [Synechococcus phage S-P4]AYR02036.1 hypothetical protein [Synechococcus phage S-E7]|tara:strand:+ start:360 stop:611 length:252 start_codon:yes stop_codon:yes gene_type:complete